MKVIIDERNSLYLGKHNWCAVFHANKSCNICYHPVKGVVLGLLVKKDMVFNDLL